MRLLAGRSVEPRRMRRRTPRDALRCIGMNTELETTRKRTPVLRKVGAGVVLVVAAALALHLVIGLVVTIFYVVLTVAVIVAILWALKTIFW